MLKPPFNPSKLTLALTNTYPFLKSMDDPRLWNAWWNWYWPGKGF